MNNLKQLETREVTVGENIFYIRPLPAFKAAKYDRRTGSARSAARIWPCTDAVCRGYGKGG